MQLWSQSQCHVWCCGCCRCAVRGVMGAVVVLHWCCGCHHHATHGVAGAIVVPRWCCRHHRCAAWVSQLPFLHHVWYCSCGC